MAVSFQELECAACDVIQIVKQIPELASAKLSVIGGLALWNYLGRGRMTDNINFITNISTSPSSVKKKLLDFPDSPFTQRAQVLYYVNQNGREIQIDISPEWLSPYLPDSAQRVQSIPYGEVPYISVIDLVIFKLDSSGLRSNITKKQRDAADAASLLEYATEHGFMHPLSDRQAQVADEALIDVVRFGRQSRAWWEARLGLSDTESNAHSRAAAPHLSPSDALTRASSSSRTASSSRNKKNSSSSGSKSRKTSSSSPRPKSPRPHSNSDPQVYLSRESSSYRNQSPSRASIGSGAGAGASLDGVSQAWYYERLDRAHVRRFNSVHGVRGSGGSLHHSPSSRPSSRMSRSWTVDQTAAPSPHYSSSEQQHNYPGYRLERSGSCASSSTVSSSADRSRSCAMTSPKTTHYARTRRAAAATTARSSPRTSGGDLRLGMVDGSSATQAAARKKYGSFDSGYGSDAAAVDGHHHHHSRGAQFYYLEPSSSTSPTFDAMPEEEDAWSSRYYSDDNGDDAGSSSSYYRRHYSSAGEDDDDEEDDDDDDGRNASDSDDEAPCYYDDIYRHSATTAKASNSRSSSIVSRRPRPRHRAGSVVTVAGSLRESPRPYQLQERDPQVVPARPGGSGAYAYPQRSVTFLL